MAISILVVQCTSAYSVSLGSLNNVTFMFQLSFALPLVEKLNKKLDQKQGRYPKVGINEKFSYMNIFNRYLSLIR